MQVLPGDRFVEVIRTLFGLAIDGRTNAKGMPSPLQLIAIAAEYDDVVIFRRPPRLVQRLLFGALAPLAHARGYRGVYPRYSDAGSMGSAEDAREWRPLTARLGDGEGPPR